MSLPRLDNRAARRLFLHKHGLAEPPTGPGKGDDLGQVIHRLGFVQVDSVNTVERAHHMILFARRQRYRPAHLAPLLETHRTLFEHWTHDAAVIPTEFYPHWRLRFARDHDTLTRLWRIGRRPGFEEQMAGVLDRIRAAGPCGSRDVGDGEARGSGGWWDWHPSKTALEFLWRTGTLAVCRRESFRKVYDLAEAVIPPAHHAPRPEEAHSRDWFCDQAIDRLGFATHGEVAAFWDAVSPAEARDWADRRLAEGRLIQVEVAGHDGQGRVSLARPDVLDAADAAPAPPGRMRVLSPFDPALRDRARAERLWGFHYRIEIFVPAPKRRYGYYVFPLLEGDRLVGRIDMKADRKAGRLDVTAVWPEPRIRWSDARHARLEAELTRVMRFAGLESLTWQDGWLRDSAP